MAASDLPLTQSAVPTHYSRSEQTGVGAGGKPIIAQVVLAGVHKRTYVGTQSLVLTTSSQSLTVPAGSPAVLADIYCEAGSGFARYWHGATPTASVGKKLSDDQELASASPIDFNAIIGTGTQTLRVEYYTNG